MAHNVEVKAKVRDRSRIEASVRQGAGDVQPQDFHQEDTFFRTTNGRLKLRVIDGARAELIHYFRNDERGPKSSRYSIVPVPDPNLLRRVLADAHGIRATVCKKRRVYLIGNTRVHLDAVEGLGEFLELEVVLAEGESEADGTAEARRLMVEFNIDEEDLVEGAYVDLLESLADELG